MVTSDVSKGARSVAILGPYSSGKTSLLESILEHTGAVTRQGSVEAGNTVGDASREARDHSMSVEINVATVEYLGEKFTFLDCPGAIDMRYEATAAISAVDAAVVVCEDDAKKVPALQLILKQLEDRGIPHFLFLNKVDKAETRVRDIIPMLQPASKLPLVLRQILIRDGDEVKGFIDLAMERAYIYRSGQLSEEVELPKDDKEREADARFAMLEKLADYDDALMELLLDDVNPDEGTVFGDLSDEFQHGDICPVLLGSAAKGNGVTRLLKALRHEAPYVSQTAENLEVSERESCAQVLKTFHTEHGGKLSLLRILTGQFADSSTVYGRDGAEDRISGIFTITGQEPKKLSGMAGPGDTVAFGKLENCKTGDTISLVKGDDVQVGIPAPEQPVMGISIAAKAHSDEVRLTAALEKIIDEFPSISLEHNQQLGELVLWGQGDMQLRIARERLVRKYGIDVATASRKIPYKETIRKSTEVRGRHKKQSGGHGQFGDVVIEIKPLPRGMGFEFSDSITGGVVPKQYIPSVEQGVREYIASGPLGFPVVDIAVHLKDGSYHSVDSSDQAFKSAGRVAMVEGMKECSPVLLEPVMAVKVVIPSDATAKVNGIISSRRGAILGFDARPGWEGWDVVDAHIPESELGDLIIELRSITAGVGTFSAKFHHLAELTGRLADEVTKSVAG
jgi:elongation factor G